MNVLMVGVDKNRNGGMWTVAENFINSKEYNQAINLTYIATSTGGSVVRRILKMLQGYVLIIKHLLFSKIDIVHIHMAEKGSVFRKAIVIMFGKLFHKRVIVQMHAGPIVSWYSSCRSLTQFLVRKIFNSPDVMLVLGEYWKKQLTELVPEKKIKVLYNGAECPSKNLYNVQGKGIVYLGLIKKTKGTFDLVDAIKLINDRLDHKYKVYLCGLDEEGKINEYIAERGLTDRIILKGWINKEERLALFQNTRMVILPSYFEALSMTVIEAMCYGIPVITTNISTMPELLGDRHLLIEPGDVEMLSEKILQLSDDSVLCKKLSSREFDRALTTFSINNVSKKLCEIYSSISVK